MPSGRCHRRRVPTRRPLPSKSPAAAAALGTVIVLPLMLAYMLFGLIDAIPVLLTTVLLVAKMEEERGAASGWAKLIGNFLGGFVAVAAYYFLALAPSLVSLALITFIIGFGFAVQIAKGGVRGGNALLAYNATMVIFGLALAEGPVQFGHMGRARRPICNRVHLRGRDDEAALAATEATGRCSMTTRSGRG